MSTFTCEICDALCVDTPRGYISGCDHYPPGVTATPAELSELLSSGAPAHTRVLQPKINHRRDPVGSNPH